MGTNFLNTIDGWRTGIQVKPKKQSRAVETMNKLAGIACRKCDWYAANAKELLSHENQYHPYPVSWTAGSHVYGHTNLYQTGSASNLPHIPFGGMAAGTFSH